MATTYFTSYNPKVRQEGFQPPSPPLSASGTSSNPNPFDPNLFVGSSTTPSVHSVLGDPFRKYGNGDVDFVEDLASLMGPNHKEPSQHGHSPAPYDDYSRHPPHNIFDVSAHPAAHHHFPSHFSLPSPGAFQAQRPGSSHHMQHHPDTPSSLHGHSNSPFNHPADSHLPHHVPLPAALPPLNINGHHPPSVESPILPSSGSPFLHTPIEHLHRPPSPIHSRSRSRSKPPSSAGGPLGIPGRSRMSKKRASMSGIERPHPSSIAIPPSRPGTSGGQQTATSPLAMHMHGPSGWPGSFNSLPTPDSLTAHGFGSYGASGATPSAPTGAPLGSSPKDMKESPPPQDPASKQAALANEKRRRRRESHNAVERRRRDNINEKISELATLIPECMLDNTPPNAPANGNSKAEVFNVSATNAQSINDEDGKETATVKANKGMILRKSVEYIRYVMTSASCVSDSLDHVPRFLQQLVSAQASRNRELESQLQRYQSGEGRSPVSSPDTNSLQTNGSSDLQNVTALTFNEELMLHSGLNIGNLGMLHSLGADNDFLNMGLHSFNGGMKGNGFDGLESIHENGNSLMPHVDQDGDEMDDDEGDARMDMETSPSAESPEDERARDDEDEERGRGRIRGQRVGNGINGAHSSASRGNVSGKREDHVAS
ncbi:HLH-domain-containing protein [Sistotremastrum suecicum HHB10207 ss-3]|uniref:HLH-domain-containing protein n=1 Tax=Sistotremastrum suecicum HHB10207 ss-3 TaxID=1314776 RepID=A0A166GD73_9AGAM|nr:HLH-domain-containing protein [Sistotremastrum suecicum HHB10207 ss-3]